MLEGKKILLVITGGIAAYKSLELIRLLQVNKASVVPVMTKSSQQFVTPLSVSAIAGSKVYTELFDLTAEAEMGHIELSRSADIILVAPASADFLSKMAQGTCDDLASTLLLATDKPVLVAPSMNVRMWHHPATQRNLNVIRDDGIITIGPNEGDMACGEFGLGRMSEPSEVITFLINFFKQGPLSGKRIIVTSGTTHEMMDPIRYIANKSSGGRQELYGARRYPTSAADSSRLSNISEGSGWPAHQRQHHTRADPEGLLPRLNTAKANHSTDTEEKQ